MLGFVVRAPRVDLRTATTRTMILAQAIAPSDGTIAPRMSAIFGNRTMTPAAALVALHAAVALFGFAGLFGKWLALLARGDRAGPHGVAAAALAIVLRFRSGERVRRSTFASSPTASCSRCTG